MLFIFLNFLHLVHDLGQPNNSLKKNNLKIDLLYLVHDLELNSSFEKKKKKKEDGKKKSQKRKRRKTMKMKDKPRIFKKNDHLQGLFHFVTWAINI